MALGKVSSASLGYRLPPCMALKESRGDYCNGFWIHRNFLGGWAWDQNDPSPAWKLEYVHVLGDWLREVGARDSEILVVLAGCWGGQPVAD